MLDWFWAAFGFRSCYLRIQHAQGTGKKPCEGWTSRSEACTRGLWRKRPLPSTAPCEPCYTTFSALGISTKVAQKTIENRWGTIWFQNCMPFISICPFKMPADLKMKTDVYRSIIEFIWPQIMIEYKRHVFSMRLKCLMLSPMITKLVVVICSTTPF